MRYHKETLHRAALGLLSTILLSGVVAGTGAAETLPVVADVEFQPLSAQVRRVVEALDMLGQPLPAAEKERIGKAIDSTDAKLGGPDDPGGPRPALPDRRSNINPESRVKAAQGPAEPDARPERLDGLPGQGPERGGRHRRARRPRAPTRRRSTSSRRGSAEPKKSIRPAEIVQRWMDVAMFRDRPLKTELSGPGRRVPDHPDLQPRRRQARGEDQLRRRPGDAGPRLPQRRRHPLRLRAGRRGRPRRPGRGRPAGDGLVRLPRRDGPGLSLAQPPAGARLLLPSADLPPERRDRAAAAGDVPGRVHPRAGVPDADPDDHRAPRPRTITRSFKLERWIHLASDELVLGRSSRPRRRLCPLREPDRGGQARGHEAAHPGRRPRRRLRAVLGPVLVRPEAVLRGQGPPALAPRNT